MGRSRCVLNRARKRIKISTIRVFLATFYFLLNVEVAFSQTPRNATVLRVIVTSNQDGEPQPDGGLTLREAIEIVNGTLPLERVSAAERGSILPGGSSDGRSQIEFNLPPGNTTIELTSPLPPLAVPVIVDGSTQPGYGRTGIQGSIPSPQSPLTNPQSPVTNLLKQTASSCVRAPLPETPPPPPETIPKEPPPPVRGLSFLKSQQGNSSLLSQSSAVSEFPIPKPAVVIKPASGAEVFRGLTVVSDKVTVRALNLYGFSTRRQGAVANIPPADIFIAHPNDTATFGISGRARSPNQIDPPKDVLIECNWLGLERLEVGVSGRKNSANFGLAERLERRKQFNPQPVEPGYFQIYPYDDTLPTRSAFGVYVFNSFGTAIRSNLIANHDGSGIITSARANNLEITENILFANGYGGMPDAIRLEGDVNKTRIVANLIRDNAGSGIYLFKTEGSVDIRENQIENNGRQFEQAAIYLMGSDHQVINNRITEQSGPGVVVAAYPNSDRNVIVNNEFSKLRGLSIDLVTQLNTDIFAYAIGDGPNPIMRSFQRRRKTANFGIDAPRFVSKEFFIDPKNSNVILQGTAKPNSRVEIYKVNENTDTRGPLSLAIANTEANEKGEFSITIANLKTGERVSAIATDGESGTSEPAVNAEIRELPNY